MLKDSVAPLAGAWIEIVNQILLSFRKGSLPLRERGLKSGRIIAQKEVI